ncbi:MAG: M48 family metallopeptidase [Oscillospiraceae bacterium]|nr:M48 family metallopeptidase [Oscillospiraceae bacterium]
MKTNVKITYALVRSKRKTVALYIRGGAVEVRAPTRMAKRDIDAFVASKEKWITDKLAKAREQAERVKAFSLDYGSAVTYRGRQYPIAARDGARAGFDGERFYMPPNLSPENIKNACAQIYRLLAKRDLADRAYSFAARMGASPRAVKINGAKTRWGSCSAKKYINFSWRLIMAEDAVIDYVVVHELAHLAEMNHSARFWAIVEGVLPDFNERKARLKALQIKLGGEDWEP